MMLGAHMGYRDKLVLLTGASSGLGWHLAEAYAAAGAKVALVARRGPALQQLAERLDPVGRTVRSYAQDLLDLDAVPRVIAQVAQEFGMPIDVLVHVAGMSCYGEVERTPFAMIDRMTDLNYLAGVRLIQEVVGGMKERRRGQIVWIGSGSSFRGIPRAAAYSASKAAVKTLCEALRTELRPFNVDVLLVVPGALETEFHDRQPNYSSDHRLRRTGAPADPARVAEAVLRAGQRRRPVLVYGRNARLAHHLAYWTPALLDRVLMWRA